MTNSAIEAILIAGPTASGKSALALEIARRVNGLVVNCDSMQVYRDLRILTARPTPDEERTAPHALYGTVDGAENFSVSRWLAAAGEVLAPTVIASRRRSNPGDAELERAKSPAGTRSARNDDHAAEIPQPGQIPIFVGGTGLYFKALTQGLSDIPTIPAAVRAEVRAWAEGRPPAELHATLAARDPTTAARLRPTDPQRLLRALEVNAATGDSLAALQMRRGPPLLDATRCACVFLAPEREALRARIDARFEAMMAAGALDEVRALGARGLDPTLPVMRAHGVPPLLRHLAGTSDLATAVEAGKADTRRYIKRQATFARHQLPSFEWVEPSEALVWLQSRCEI